MKNEIELIENVVEGLGIEMGRFTLSVYGEKNGVNIRVANHLPKVHNLLSYEETFTVESGVCKLLLCVVTDESIDTNEVKWEIQEQLNDETSLDCDFEVQLTTIGSDDDISYAKMLLRTI